MTNIAGGVLRLLGAFTVDQVSAAAEGVPPGVSWDAKEYLWPAAGTATEFAIRELPLAIVDSLRFQGGADRVAMDQHRPGHVERNAMRKVRRLSPASAQLLEDALSASGARAAVPNDRRSLERLPAEVLRQVTPDFIFAGVAAALSGAAHEFGESTDYDLITDEGQRLAPKAVFGLALSLATNRAIVPKHFAGGDGSLCFRLLRDAGYRVVPKGEQPKEDLDLSMEGAEESWTEGSSTFKRHVGRERRPAAARAKKAAFIKQHGRLFCERCKADPITIFGSEHGEACIEVHHALVQVSDMPADHLTKLEDLQCLCANCHRYVHRLLRLGLNGETR
ncbi:hypothetical protein LZ017_08110 [Pelomonas sp. CA6]|uniref:hypothetical protein n=1 Tax=Pelomonas sp. CA6 TaxID=2907999 RepID=UPI001F4BF4CF|nr:hypothetical protein [Pelomonas sp. CA6]MCH7343342.1 hypothetical protein [Pelomonas sp. CA6]